MCALKGVLKTKEHKNRISESIKKWHKEKGHSENIKNRISLSLKGKYIKEKSPWWRGSDASYQAKHMWLYRHYGKASYCENDPSHKSKRFQWANLSGKYLRDRKDYKSLCCSCHKKMDLANGAKRKNRNEIKKEIV